MKTLILTAVAGLLFILPAHAQGAGANERDAAKRFAAAASSMNKFEIAAAEIVLAKGRPRIAATMPKAC